MKTISAVMVARWIKDLSKVEATLTEQRRASGVDTGEMIQAAVRAGFIRDELLELSVIDVPTETMELMQWRARDPDQDAELIADPFGRQLVLSISVLPSFCGLRRGVRKESGKAEILWKRIRVVLAGFVCCLLAERDSAA
jgi:hypothetical protein